MIKYQHRINESSNYKLLLIYLMACMCFACSKDDNNNNSGNENTTYEPVTTKVIGLVVNANGDAVSDALVSVNNTEQTTDEFGTFRFEAQELNGKGQLITISKEGFYEVGKLFNPTSDATSSLSIQLITKRLNATISASAGGLIAAQQGGATVSIPPNAIVDENGSPYSGQVEVYAYWLDPTDLKTLDEMPGDLRGMNTSGEQVQLVTYGMMAIELNAPNGDKLNLGNGQEAQLNFPVPSSLLADAPADIPLWSYDEATGNWMEEGMAILVGNAYQGSVSHFSFWNCDVDFTGVDFELCIQEADGTPLTYSRVAMKLSDGFTGGSATDANGKARGIIPVNEPIQVILYDRTCSNEVVYNETIGPFSGPGSYSITYEPLLPLRTVRISGNFINCEENPITNGVVLGAGYGPIEMDANGSIDVSYQTCLTQASLDLIDYDQNVFTSKTFPTSQVTNSIQFSDEVICANPQGDQLTGIWRKTFWTIDGFDAIPFYELDDEFTEYDGAGNYHNLFVTRNETNKSEAVGTYLLASDLSSIEITGPGGSSTAEILNLTQSVLEWKIVFGATSSNPEVWIEHFERVTTDLCSGVTCAAGSECKYGYCLP